MKRVAILGGSFDPPHVGHEAICRWAGKNRVSDEVWVIPCFMHPFGKNMSMFEDRYNMCSIAFRDLPFVMVMDVERRLGGKSVTIRTLAYLKDKNPHCAFVMLVGSDARQEFCKWRDYEKLEQLAEVEVIPRGPASFIPDVSSTEIRAKISSGEHISGLVSRGVADYIGGKGLYRG